MQNKKFKFATILSTVLLALSVLITSISAVTVAPRASQANSSATFVGTKTSNSLYTASATANSKASSSIASSKPLSTIASSSQKSAVTTASSKSSSSAVASSNSSSQDNPFVGNGSMVDDDSNSEGYIGKYQVTTHPTYGNDVAGLPQGNGIYPHFDVNDDIGKCYCYDWKIPAPDEPGTNYNGYKFYDGMKVATNKQKADEVAAALMAGYHLDKTTNQWEMSAALQQEAQDGYNLLMKDYKDNNYTPDANDTLGNLIYDQDGDKLQLSPNYTLADYERDVTQSVIWKIGGADDSSADLANKTKLGRDLYAYAMSHPLDQQTAYSNNLKAVSQGSQLSVNHPLTIDPTTLKSQTFHITGYNGEVGIKNLDPNVQVIDSATGKPTLGLLSGHTYYLQAKKLNTANKKNYFDLSYENLAESHYFSVEDLNATSLEANNKYQNMVNLATKSLNLSLNYVYRQSSSSSLATSSSSSKLSSSIKSSSIASSSKSSSSIKSSSVASSSKSSSSSKKSSSVVSSSKSSLSSKKSSSVVSSSKSSLSSKKSSSVVSSSKSSLSSKKSSSVVSSSKSSLSSKKSSSIASSSKSSLSSKKSSSIASSSKSSSSSKKSSSVVSSSKSSLNSKKSSSVVSSSKSSSSSKKSSSVVLSSKSSSSSKKSSSVVLSSKSSLSSKKSSSVVLSSKSSLSSKKSSSVVSSSEQGAKVSSSSSQVSQKKQGVVAGNSSQKVAQGSKHGKGEGHGMPQTGEAATALVFVGVALLATAGAIELRKNK